MSETRQEPTTQAPTAQGTTAQETTAQGTPKRGTTKKATTEKPTTSGRRSRVYYLLPVVAVASAAIGFAAGASRQDDESGSATQSSPPSSTPASSTPASSAPAASTPASSTPASSPAITVPEATQSAAVAPVPPATSAGATPVTTPSPPGCGLTAAAFCETFDAPAGNGGKTGHLDPVLWGVSRLGNINPGSIHNAVSYTSMTGCESSDFLPAPNDVRICNGQMLETVNDGGGVSSLHTYPKQPFNFEGRTGKVVFDVSADSSGTHGAWPEFFITDKPVPGMRAEISGQIPPGAANSVGFALAGCEGPAGHTTGVSAVFVTKDNVYTQPAFTAPECITKGSASAMNHIEVRVSTDRMEVWGTDAGSTTLKQLAVADNLGLTFTQGLVWLNDVHYNARKAIEPSEGTQWNHTFAWDNLGFDGPKTYRDLGFDTPDANLPGNTSEAGDETRTLGYLVGEGPITLDVAGVNWVQEPTGALVVLNTYSFAAVVPSVSINGGPWIDTPWPYDEQTFSWRSLAIPVPFEQIREGANTISLRSGDASTTVANVTLILVAAAPVP